MQVTPRDAARDAELNMTPMIDIVFQLILFFLFTLRFKSLDYRIETRLPDRMGISDGPTVVPPPSIRATLFRLDADDPARARTRLRVGGQDWDVPEAARSGDAERDAFVLRLSRHFESLRAVAPDVHGKIDTPLPSGALVPHGDVVAVLDAFVKAHFDSVEFVGTPAPRPRAR
jgi:biopolymer transport protein ExbD